MLTTSGTYDAQSVQIEVLIREAYERIGILGEMLESQKLDTARRSLDFLLQEWMIRTTNLWTLKAAFLPLTPSQGKYNIPLITDNILQVNLRTSNRQLNGIPASSAAGNAEYAFDGNPLTACTQNAPDGNISYDYGAGQTQKINFVGVTSNIEEDYTLVVESSQDGVSWTEIATFPKQTFLSGVNVWLDILIPAAARYYRIRETGGKTLDIQEIYFNNNIYDYSLSKISRDEYYTYPNKRQEGRPTVFYLDRQIEPELFLWPIPSNQYNCLQYTYKQMIQDVGVFYSDTVEIPSRFYPALVWGLSYYLAIKFKPDLTGILKGEYLQAFDMAQTDDTEGITMSIYPDTTYNYGCL